MPMSMHRAPISARPGPDAVPAIRDRATCRAERVLSATRWSPRAPLVIVICGWLSGCVSAAGSAVGSAVEYVGGVTGDYVADWRYQSMRNEPLSSYEATDLKELIIDLDAMDGTFVVLTTTLEYESANKGHAKDPSSGAMLSVGYKYLDRIDRKWLVEHCAKGCFAKLYGYVRSDDEDDGVAVVALHLEH